MERILYDSNGTAVAYIAEDYRETIYLWEGLPAAYLYEGEHVYGFNGLHLGWFKGDVLFDHHGRRVGFLYTTCPVPIIKPPAKWKKSTPDEIRPRWAAPPPPKLGYQTCEEDLASFLKRGLVNRAGDDTSSAELSG